MRHEDDAMVMSDMRCESDSSLFPHPSYLNETYGY
jgi:hypothetical protein